MILDFIQGLDWNLVFSDWGIGLMSRNWPVQEAKARFSELLETSLSEGPQIVSKRGVEMAVLVPIKEWWQLQKRARPTV